MGADNFDVLQRQDVPTAGDTSVALTVTGAGIGLVQLSTAYYEDAETAESYDVTTVRSPAPGPWLPAPSLRGSPVTTDPPRVLSHAAP